MDPRPSPAQPSTARADVTVVRVFGDPLFNGEPATLDLARTVVASPFFANLPEAVAAFRPGAGMVVVGRLTDEEVARLQAFEEESARGRARLVLLSYGDVEDLTGLLAGRLRDTLGPSIAEAGFQPIPRGGLLVLGLLAYHLDLGPTHLSDAPEPGAPLVVIDDCSISGRRFHDVLRSLPDDGPVVFGTLFSHPELRRRILVSEPRVRDVVSARDLEDLAPSILGAVYPEWRARWDERGVDGYWTGITEHVVFPWSEPDTAVWDPVARDTVHGWRVAGPEHCLKNRLAFGRSEHRLQVFDPSRRGFVPAPDVVCAVFEENLVVTSLGSGRVVSMERTAPLLWQAIAGEDGLDEAAAALADTFDMSADELRQEVAAFARDMVALDLMEQAP